MNLISAPWLTSCQLHLSAATSERGRGS